MSTFPYYILLLFFLHQRKLAADGWNGGTADEDKCSPEIIKQLSETMDLVCEVNSRLNNTEVYLAQLKKEMSRIRDSSVDINCARSGPRDCSDIRAMGFTDSGVYPIYAGGDDKRMHANVYCDFSSFKKSWLVFQRRKDGSENFERLYTEYESGFGNLSGEFWLGNEVLHLLTTNRKYKLRIDLEDFEGQRRYAEYTTFVINSAADSYRLNVGGYFGNAGDSMSVHNKMKFSTKDIDNDALPTGSCAQTHRGAWWYEVCHQANLNGLYLRGPHQLNTNGIEWHTWHGLYYSLKKTEMKLIPLEDVTTTPPISRGV